MLGVHVSHIIVDAVVDTQYTDDSKKSSPDASKCFKMKLTLNTNGLLVADTYWHLHTQHHTAWTYELDVRPDVEKW